MSKDPIDPRRRNIPVDTRRKLTTKDVLILIFRAYRDTFPFVLLFVLLLIVGSWVLTEVVFR